MTLPTVLQRHFIDDRLLGDANILLSEYRLLRVRGHKAFDFLQGQLSCDVRQVNDRQGAHGLFCDLKGRIQHSLDVLFWDNDYYLLLVRDLCPDFIKQVRTVAMLSRIELTEASYYQLQGQLLDAQVEDERPLKLAYDAEKNCRYYHIFPGARLVITQTETPPIDNTPLSLRWQEALLDAEYFRLYPETQGQFLPHRLGLQKGGWIAFDKGCYRGQEIIARTHYRASLKHHLQSVQLESNAAIFPGMELYAQETGQSVAEVVDCLPKIQDNTVHALISLKADYEFEALQDASGTPVQMRLM